MSDLIRVSHSQLSQWDRCCFAWDLSYNGKWTPKQTAYPLTLGSMVHEFLEDYYRGQMDGVGDSLVRHQEKVAQRANSIGDSDELQALSQAATLVERYIAEFAVFEDANWRVIDVEKHYEVELETPKGRPFLFELYFDILWLDTVNDKIWLGDHKTHKSRPYTDNRVMMDNQLPAYAMALRELLGIDVFGVVYNMINTYDYKKPPPSDKLFLRKKSYRTQRELDSIMEEIGLAVDEIVDHEGKYRRSKTPDCDWCRFRDPCLMGTKGFDMLPILEENFEKKKGRPKSAEEEEESS